LADKHIANAADRPNQARRRRRRLELPAQSRDLRIDGSIERASFSTSRQIHEPIAAHYFARVLDQGNEHIELAAGQDDLNSIWREQRAAAQIEPPAIKFEGLAVRYGGRPVNQLLASQDAAYAG
jgi:hypothetical protein